MIFNIYRELYPLMTIEEKIKWHSAAYACYPDQDHFNVNALMRFLRWVGATNVVGMGGWRGEAAARVLPHFPQIKSWRNHELCVEARLNSRWSDKRYTSREAPLYFEGEVPGRKGEDTFVASHVLEHLSEEEIEDTLDLAKSVVKCIYIDCPVEEDVQDSTSYHVVSDAWGIITPIMSDWTLDGKGHSEHGLSRWYSR